MRRGLLDFYVQGSIPHITFTILFFCCLTPKHIHFEHAIEKFNKYYYLLFILHNKNKPIVNSYSSLFNSLRFLVCLFYSTEQMKLIKKKHHKKRLFLARAALKKIEST